ncbi:MAG: hypothetical protein ACRC35_09895 [Angustibacter sp.]
MTQDHEPDPGGDADVDAEFARIVAGWSTRTSDVVPRWPVTEDDEPAASSSPTRSDPPSADEPTTTASRWPTGPVDHPPPADDLVDPPVDGGLGHGHDRPVAGGPPELGPRDWEPASDQEHFVPPEPPPLPRGDPATRLAWAAVLLGPVFLLCSALFWRDIARWWLIMAAAAFVAGFVALAARLPARRDDSDDDGAVV